MKVTQYLFFLLVILFDVKAKKSKDSHVCFLLQAEDPLQLASSTSLGNEETNSGEWTSDDIPEFLNIIRKEVDAEKKSPDTVGGDGQMETEQKEETGQKVKTEQKEETEQKVETEAEAQPPPLDPWAKLMSVRTKNPVSGLTEYARYLRHPCEFLHLNCSGPSHRPRLVPQTDGRKDAILPLTNIHTVLNFVEIH